MKINLRYLIGILVLVLISSNAYSFGATQPGTVFVPVGESKVIDFSVQNGGGATEDVIATLSVVTGADIVEFIEDNAYMVPAGGETTAKIKINVPRNANPDDKWNVKLSFRAKPVESSVLSGMVALSNGVDIRFDVVASEPVVEPPSIIPTAEVVREVSSNGVIALVVIIIAAIIIYLITRKKKMANVEVKRKRKK